MNRRDLFKLGVGALVSGVEASRTYSFLVNNPLALAPQIPWYFVVYPYALNAAERVAVRECLARVYL